jgi:rhomboid family GlyGly-CTERM serine protease
MRTSTSKFFGFPCLTLLLSAAAIAAWYVPNLAGALEYDRAALSAGQYWRIFTCHWAHFSLDHLRWDVAAFAVLATVCERRNRATLFICIGLSAIVIPAVVWFLLPRIQAYRGLSGIDSALFIFLAIDLLRSEAHTGGSFVLVAGIAIALLLFVAKTVVEVVWGHTLFVDSTAACMVPVPLVHLAGGLTGFLCGFGSRV